MEMLEKLFGSAVKVKLMKLFLFNSNSVFDKQDIQKRTKSTTQSTTRELNILEKAGFLKKKSFFKEGKKLKSGKVGKKKRVQGYVLNQEFPYLLSLQKMLIESSPIGHSEVIKRIQKSGKIKLITVAGVFIHDDESRLDLLVVGDNINSGRIKTTIGSLESEIGRPIKYSILDTGDFKYRMGICDRLVRDVFDFPHEVLVDRINS